MMKKYDIPLLASDESIVLDRRLISAFTMDSAREAYVPATIEEHRQRSCQVRRRLLLSAGLLPEMELPPAKVYQSAAKEYHGVNIRDVVVNSLPGLRLTGSLFLPEKFEGKLPGLLCPHGHWSTGRIHHAPDGGVVMRCFELAKLGFAVFAYDMIGYNECNDFPHDLDREMKRKGALAGVSTFGMQTVNSMRAVDFIASLPEVDAGRIGCTGASGGGSQTWFISALDERIKVLAPVCMLSAHFQGGCGCEEGPALRVSGLTSFDVVSACAPRPVMLPSVTGDWTNCNPWYEVPQLKKVYALYDAADKVHNFHYEDGHNYNRRTREHVYAFLVRELQGIDRGEKIIESDDAPPPPEVIWHSGAKPAAATARSAEKAYEALENFLLQNLPDTNGDPAAWQRERKELLKELLSGAGDFTKGAVERVSAYWDVPGGKAFGRIVSNREAGNRITTVDLRPDEVKNDEVLIIAAAGAYTDWFSDGCQAEKLAKILRDGQRVRLVELTGSGSQAWQLAKAIRNPERFTLAFDESFFSMRVQDLVSVVELLRLLGDEKLRISAAGDAVLAALAAAALTGVPVDVDMAGVNEDIWMQELNYQVLIRRLGGIAGLLRLNAGKDNRISNLSEKIQ